MVMLSKSKDKLDLAFLSEKGGRSINEDSVRCKKGDGSYCFVVCDGLGGHGMGDTASRLVADSLAEKLASRPLCEDLLSSAFSEAQEELISFQSEHKIKNKMRTTAAAVLIYGGEMHICHVGDSRVYVFDKNGIKHRTLDHSVPQILALSGEITEGEIRKHPDRNKVLRAMGTEWDRPMYERSASIPLSECRALLLCSDGFWEHIDESDMLSVLNSSRTARHWLKKMRSTVIKNGKGSIMDNFSAIAVLIKYQRSVKK